MNSAIFCARLALLLKELDGIDPTRALEGTGFDNSLFNDPYNIHIESDQQRKIYENVAKLTHTPWIGFEAGEQNEITDMGPLGLGLISAETVGDMLSFNENYLQTVEPPCLSEVVRNKDTVKLRLVEAYPMTPKMQRIAAEEILAVWVGFPADGLTDAVYELRVTFDKPEHPLHLKKYSELLPRGFDQLRFKHVFERKRHKILAEAVFPAFVWDLPMPRPRKDIHEANLLYCKNRLTQLHTEGRWEEKVRNLLIANYGEVSKAVWKPADVALKMDITLRQLERYLEKEGTTPQHVITDVRRVLVEDYVTSKLTNKQLGRMVGLKEKGFITWFKGHYGCTRTEYIAQTERL